MGFLQALFGGKEESPEEKEKKKNERDFDVLKYDGIRARRIGEFGYATKCFKQALAIQEDNEILGYLAECLMLSGEKEEGYNTYLKLVELNPHDPKYLLFLAQLEESRMNYNKMEEYCEAALKIDSENATAIYLSARARYLQKDELRAIILLTQAITKNENLTEAYQLRADILEKMDCLKDAEESLEPMMEKEDTPEEIMIRKANLCLKQGKTEEAITYYNKVKEKNPMYRPAYIGLSTAYSINKQLDLSLDTLNDVLEFMPDFAEGFKERGRIKLMLNDKEGAAEDLKKALEINPKTFKNIDGKFSNIETEMTEQYKSRNPFGF